MVSLLDVNGEVVLHDPLGDDLGGRGRRGGLAGLDHGDGRRLGRLSLGAGLPELQLMYPEPERCDGPHAADSGDDRPCGGGQGQAGLDLADDRNGIFGGVEDVGHGNP